MRRFLPNQRVTDTARLARLNLAVHGLIGEWSGAIWTLPQERPERERGGAHQINKGNTCYEDLRNSFGRFDFAIGQYILISK